MDGEDIEPVGDRPAGRAETPGQGGRVGVHVAGAVLFEDVACHQAIKELLSLVAQRVPADKLSIRIDEPHVFRIGSPDGRPPAFRVSLGKDLVQVAMKQLRRCWHWINPLCSRVQALLLLL
jgi:hypothetical protein